MNLEKAGFSEALTWDQLADEYDKVHSGRKARTLQMESIFAWAEKQTDKFMVSKTQGTIHKILNK
jgi:hypothetical protein